MAITLISKPIHWDRVSKQSQGDLEHCSGRGAIAKIYSTACSKRRFKPFDCCPGCGRLWERHGNGFLFPVGLACLAARAGKWGGCDEIAP